ncbi:DNA-directed RNA polymerase subunit beta [Bacillus sp. THAF10]|uniref:DNA-directed RNA polymerase subunit beta n=1 Tax=Bacillus sp. THAF10 TaxID=2587848 RepID=UPI0012682625|nr:DNA-directed RNA polymerase subunit beta [Bacillus sp. THAF10]QFT90873.1 DNA-directed RNA polymerase subunit beta [Bacillus sp. THAF10]
MEQEEPKSSVTRAELRKAQKQKERKETRASEQEQEKAPKKLKWRIRLIPIWLRLVIILAIMAVAVVAGAMFGYAILGGGEPMDVLKKETWQHILDLVNKD